MEYCNNVIETNILIFSPIFQHSSIPILILPRHPFTFHSTALNTVIHAELSPGHKEKQEMRKFGKRYGN